MDSTMWCCHLCGYRADAETDLNKHAVWAASRARAGHMAMEGKMWQHDARMHLRTAQGFTKLEAQAH
eukprot:6336854-Alexandrium_andersonii.AAC.1